MKMMKIAAFSAALLSSGCASEMVWQRVDGRPVDQGFRYAAAECRGRAEHHEEAAVEAMKRCMYRRGYVWTAVYTGNGNGYNGNGYNGNGNGGNGYKSYGNRGNGHNGYDNDD